MSIKNIKHQHDTAIKRAFEGQIMIKDKTSTKFKNLEDITMLIPTSEGVEEVVTMASFFSRMLNTNDDTKKQLTMARLCIDEMVGYLAQAEDINISLQNEIVDIRNNHVVITKPQYEYINKLLENYDIESILGVI